MGSNEMTLTPAAVFLTSVVALVVYGRFRK